MLFSDKKIASYINDNFEPAWESVRSVPKITADFGDGHVITKTFRGNIATYVCNSEGSVADVLPGLYSPAAYLRELVSLCRREPASASLIITSKPLPPSDAIEAMLRGVSVNVPSADLSADTDINEHERRHAIHQKLAQSGPITPAALKPWLYKEVLHCDLSDPYLGMRDLLLAGSQAKN